MFSCFNIVPNGLNSSNKFSAVITFEEEISNPQFSNASAIQVLQVLNK